MNSKYISMSLVLSHYNGISLCTFIILDNLLGPYLDVYPSVDLKLFLQFR